MQISAKKKKSNIKYRRTRCLKYQGKENKQHSLFACLKTLVITAKIILSSQLSKLKQGLQIAELYKMTENSGL